MGTKFLNISVEADLGGDSSSDVTVSSQKAIKTYVDSSLPTTFIGASSSSAGSAGLVPAPSAGEQGLFLRGDADWGTPTDTKNTAGASDSSSKLFLIGATAQSANPVTYSQDTAYVGEDGKLYSGSKVVLTDHQDISGKADKSSIIAGTAGTSSATSGITLDVPFLTLTGQGVVSAYGTHVHTVSEMTGATASSAGTSGLVPAPSSGSQNKFLKGDGTWGEGVDESNLVHIDSAETITGTKTFSNTIVGNVNGGLSNNNSSSSTTFFYDWIGTKAEYTAQQIATLHPTWVCFITDDYSSLSLNISLKIEQLESEISSGAEHTLPDSLSYTMGKNELEVTYNGVVLYPGYNYTEYSTTSIILLFNCNVGDILSYRVFKFNQTS